MRAKTGPVLPVTLLQSTALGKFYLVENLRESGRFPADGRGGGLSAWAGVVAYFCVAGQPMHWCTMTLWSSGSSSSRLRASLSIMARTTVESPREVQ